MAEPMEVTDGTFEKDVLKSDTPVLMDFWGASCPPCEMIAPVLEQIAGEYEGKLKITKLDADHNPNTVMKFGVMSIPTLILFKNGREVERLIGFKPKNRLLARLKPHLA